MILRSLNSVNRFNINYCLVLTNLARIEATSVNNIKSIQQYSQLLLIEHTGVNNVVELSARTVINSGDMSITHVHSFALDGVAQTQVSNPTFVKECSENASQKLLKSIQYIDALRKGITVENEEKYLKRLKKLKKKVTWKALKVEERLQRRIQRKWKKYGIN